MGLVVDLDDADQVDWEIRYSLGFCRGLLGFYAAPAQELKAVRLRHRGWIRVVQHFESEAWMGPGPVQEVETPSSVTSWSTEM